VAFKPNSSSIVVQNLHCQGCHGISVGSLGQYVGEVDIVEDIYVYNSTMTKCGDIGKVKVWPGAAPGGGTSSGGGSGHVKNITWEAMVSDGSDGTFN
jgi:galacturan 1,4-alpha-galacturonidase